VGIAFTRLKKGKKKRRPALKSSTGNLVRGKEKAFWSEDELVTSKQRVEKKGGNGNNRGCGRKGGNGSCGKKRLAYGRRVSNRVVLNVKGESISWDGRWGRKKKKKIDVPENRKRRSRLKSGARETSSHGRHRDWGANSETGGGGIEKN